MLRVMTPLLGTKTPSALVGAKSGGERRTARLPLSCALWSGMGGYGAAWAAAVPRTGSTDFPVHRPSDISSGANQAPQPWFSRNTKHETRITAFTAVRFSVGARGVASPETAVRTTAPAGKSLFSSSPLFTIVHDCSRLFAIVRHCSPKNIVLRQCPRAARSLLSCALWRGMGRLWRGMGGSRPPHRQHGLSGFHESRDPAVARRAASASANSEVFTRHETQDTNHGLYAFHESRLFPRMLRP